MTAMTSPTRCRVFDRIVCGIDTSPLSREAVRQACVLTSMRGEIELVAVAQTLADEYSIYGPPAGTSEREHALAQRLAEAKEICPRAAAELLHGPKVARLLDLLDESDATLVAVGAASRHRGIGIVRGDLATEMLHRAPASVLVARASDMDDRFPRSVVVGYDGSPGAEAALGVARDIADGFDTSVRVDCRRRRVARRARIRGARSRTGQAPSGRSAPRRVIRGRPPRPGKPQAARPARRRQRQRAARPPRGVLGARRPGPRNGLTPGHTRGGYSPASFDRWTTTTGQVA
jgi:nucleotide-binding universal stress UspA family protein